jgi:hypothetical protein
LLRREPVDIELAAQETELLCGPEREPDRILNIEFRKSSGDVQDANDTRAIVVNTGTFCENIG